MIRLSTVSRTPASLPTKCKNSNRKNTPMIRIATFDIETTALSADFGVILCAVVKEQTPNAKPQVFRADELNPHWDSKRSFDKPVVKAILDCLCEYDVLVAHNGLKFDIPFIRTRLAKWRLHSLPDIKLIDPVQLARNKMRMSYNSLERLADYLGVNSKTPVTGDMWMRAALDGDRKSMDYIVKHCIEDVYTLDKIVDMVKPYSKAFNSFGSGI